MYCTVRQSPEQILARGLWGSSWHGYAWQGVGEGEGKPVLVFFVHLPTSAELEKEAIIAGGRSRLHRPPVLVDTSPATRIWRTIPRVLSLCIINALVSLGIEGLLLSSSVYSSSSSRFPSFSTPPLHLPIFSTMDNEDLFRERTSVHLARTRPLTMSLLSVGMPG